MSCVKKCETNIYSKILSPLEEFLLTPMLVRMDAQRESSLFAKKGVQGLKIMKRCNRAITSKFLIEINKLIFFK